MIYSPKKAHPVALVLEMQKESLQVQKAIANGEFKYAENCLENIIAYATEMTRRVRGGGDIFSEGD